MTKLTNLSFFGYVKDGTNVLLPISHFISIDERYLEIRVRLSWAHLLKKLCKQLYDGIILKVFQPELYLNVEKILFMVLIQFNYFEIILLFS